MFDSGGPGSTTYYDFEIHMGLTDQDTLGPIFDDNYIPGTKTVAMERNSMLVSTMPDHEIELVLDSPFSYNLENNLLIEVAWNGCSEEGDAIFSWNWPTTGRRTIVGKFGSPGATIFRNLAPWLILDSPAGLQTTTWGSIKALF